MSATLSFASSGNGAKTGTTNAAFLDDFDTLITSKAADPTFKWEKAGKSSAATPRWLLLRRKDGSNGRIALVIWDSAPAGVNTGILDQTPSVNAVLGIWFPNGTGTTLSNLAASSGTVCGNDAGVVKAQVWGAIASLYAASVLPYYMDSDEAMIFACQNPAGSDGAFLAIGDMVVDAADNAYGAIVPNSALNTFGTGGGWAWNTSFPNAGAATAVIRTNYGSANRAYWPGYSPSGGWAQSAVSSTDILTDTALNKAWFPPIQLLGQTKGEGFVLKLRQIGYGPGSVGPFTVYNTTGPVAAARQICNRTVGANGHPWVTNFKI